MYANSCMCSMNKPPGTASIRIMHRRYLVCRNQIADWRDVMAGCVQEVRLRCEVRLHCGEKMGMKGQYPFRGFEGVEESEI